MVDKLYLNRAITKFIEMINTLYHSGIPSILKDDAVKVLYSICP